MMVSMEGEEVTGDAFLVEDEIFPVWKGTFRLKNIECSVAFNEVWVPSKYRLPMYKDSHY